MPPSGEMLRDHKSIATLNFVTVRSMAMTPMNCGISFINAPRSIISLFPTTRKQEEAFFGYTTDTVFVGTTGSSGNCRHCNRRLEMLVIRLNTGYYAGSVVFTAIADNNGNR